MARVKKGDQEKTTQQTRQRLLDAAAGEFARAGYLGANINSISNAAGFAKGTVYNYFPSKQGLLLALIESSAQHHLDFIVSRVRPEAHPVRRLELFFQAGFDFVALYLPQARVLFNTLSDPDEPLKARVVECYQPMFQFLAAEILAPGIETGVFRPMEPRAMAMLLMTVYLGTASQHNLEGKLWLEAHQVADLVLHGLLRPEEVENDRS